MFIGSERRTRLVALVLAVVLVAGVVLALLVTVAQATPAHAAPAHAAPAHAAPAHAAPAQAAPPAALPTHTSLVSVVPADAARLDRGPAQVELTFDEAVNPQLVQVRLTRDGMPVATSAPTVDGAVVTVRVTGEPAAGAYRVAWHVTGGDGHPVTGESSFTVSGAAGARPKATPTYKTPQTQATTFGHPDHRPGWIVAGLLLLGGVALLVYEHRHRSAVQKRRERQRIS